MAAIAELEAAVRRVAYLGGSQRSQEFNRADLYYWGRQFDGLEPWESDADVPMRERKPSVILRWTKLCVDRVNAHLFGAGRLPAVLVAALGDEDLTDNAGADALNDAQRTALADANRQLGALLRHCKMTKHAPEVGRLGLLHGTVGIAFHKLESGRIWLEVLTLADALPVFARDDWQRADELGADEADLLQLDEYWREFVVSGDSEEVEMLHRRLWTPEGTVYYEPIDASTLTDAATDKDWKVDKAKSITHNLGFVPVVWIKNIEVTGDIDGAPLVEDAERALEDEVSYTLSQTGRGVRYNQEPLPVFKDVANIDVAGPDFRRGAGRSLSLQSASGSGQGGGNADVTLLEMTGSGIGSAQAYLEVIKKAYFEVLSVVLHDPERWAGASSGVALERLMMPMIALVDRLRSNYGEGLARLAELMLRADGVEGARCMVKWPRVVEPTATDTQAIVFAVRDLYAAKLITLKTAVELLAPFTQVQDPVAYLTELEAEAGSAASGAGTAGQPDPFGGF